MLDQKKPECLKNQKHNSEDRLIMNPFNSSDIATCSFCENFYVCKKLLKLKKSKFDEAPLACVTACAQQKVYDCIASRVYLYTWKHLRQFFLTCLQPHEYLARYRWLHGKGERSTSMNFWEMP